MTIEKLWLNSIPLMTSDIVMIVVVTALVIILLISVFGYISDRTTSKGTEAGCALLVVVGISCALVFIPTCLRDYMRRSKIKNNQVLQRHAEEASLLLRQVNDLRTRTNAYVKYGAPNNEER